MLNKGGMLAAEDAVLAEDVESKLMEDQRM
jgi:hypothetical protein